MRAFVIALCLVTSGGAVAGDLDEFPVLAVPVVEVSSPSTTQVSVHSGWMGSAGRAVEVSIRRATQATERATVVVGGAPAVEVHACPAACAPVAPPAEVRKKKDLGFGVNAGLSFGTTNLFDTNQVLQGLEVSMMFKHRGVLGVQVLSSIPNMSSRNVPAFTMVGLTPGWVMGAHKRFHLRTDTFVGMGVLWTSDLRKYATSFVVTPRIGLELNIAKPFRLSLNGGYRFVSAPQPELRALRGWNWDLTLRVGWF